MDAFIGADADDPAHLRQRRVFACGKRLLDKRDACSFAGRQVPLQVLKRPCLVGVDDQLRFRRMFAHGCDAFGIAVAAELDLEERAAGGLCGCGRHGLRRAERDRVGGGARGRGRAIQQRPDPLVAAFGFKVAQCAVQRIAGRACRHEGGQGLAIQTRGDRLLHCEKAGNNAFRSFTIAGVWNAFSASGVSVPADLGDDHDGFGLCPAADRETARDRPALDAASQCGCVVLRRFQIGQVRNGDWQVRNEQI